MSKFYITTPIYYVNDKPHLGHAYTTLCADILARWHEIKGDEVFFLTGTDEHGAKVQQSAEAAGLTPQDFVDTNSQKFKDAWLALNIEPDYFIRTSQVEHETVVREVLQKVYDRGFIYKGIYEGLYCVGCEKFLQTDDLVNNKCPLHPNQEPVHQKEENYFFKLSAWRDTLLKSIEEGKYAIVPEERKNEVVGKLKKGLDDISISRADVSWGVKVPWDESQTIYVWVDALINYYSATQFVPNKKDFWPAQVHLLAKDILWFHAVIWEALLLAADLKLPKIVATHGFFTIDGQKMSKSLGNIIDPIDLVKEFGVESVRYLVMAELPFTSDGDISIARLRGRYQSVLANGLGNCFSRVTNMISSYAQGKILPTVVKELKVDDFELALNNFRFDQALSLLMSWVRLVDGEIETAKPWQMFKDGKVDEVAKLLGRWSYVLLLVGKLLTPFMPQTAESIQKVLKADTISKAEPLFPRLN